MHDMMLGAPVDVGQYTGPLLEGSPIHNGNCEDGVYGCRMCNRAASKLTVDQLKSIGWTLNQDCDWCNKEVPTSDIRGMRPVDEPHCYYEVCSVCSDKNIKEILENFYSNN